jgi:hypothetical protein
MRKSSILVLAILVLICGFAPMASAQAPAAGKTAAVGSDAATVQAFVSTLNEALTIENQLRVASLFKYPLDVWVDGQSMKIRSDAELLAHYRQIFDPTLRKMLAEFRADTMAMTADGVAIDGGRLVLRGNASGKNLKVVKIGEPVMTR